MKNVLKKAADIIETGGWCQGVMKTDDGCRCAFSAMREAANQIYPAPSDAARVMLDAQKHLISHVGSSVTRWNDHPQQTKEDVMRVLRELGS